jgi:UDP-4-amino-4,6-dideoxy-N-acetyl-beta-L-altrosamine transaminase
MRFFKFSIGQNPQITFLNKMSSNSPFLPYARQEINSDDIAAVVKVLEGDFLTTGPTVSAFESALANRIGAADAIACSSGTAALHLAALAIDLGPGDAVIVPTVTFLATANAVRFVGAEVVFTDVDPDSGLMRESDLAKALERAPSAKAVFPVHLRGQTVDMKNICRLARQQGLKIVEDACHALGTIYDDGKRRVGDCSESDLAVYSFHPVKAIAMGEGGAIATDDPKIAARLRSIRNHGMITDPNELQNHDLAFDDFGDKNPWYYEMANLGFNYRASDVHCALGLSQLSRLDEFLNKRRKIVEWYDAGITNLSPIVCPIRKKKGETPGWHLYGVLVDFEAAKKSRSDVMNELKNCGVGSQVHYIPVHLQPYYQERYGEISLPGALRYYGRCLSLPLHTSMTEADVERVIETLADVLQVTAPG